MNTVLRGLLIFICAFFSLNGSAQEIEEYYDEDKLVIIDLGFSLGDAASPFSRHAPDLMAGGNLGFYFQLKGSQPFAIGIDFSYHYVDGHSVEFTDFIDGLAFDLKERASTHMITVLPSVRFYPDIDLKRVKPYVQASLGAKVFFTDNYLFDLNGGDNVSEYDIEDSSLSWSYGGALGLNIDLGSFVFLNASVGLTPGVSSQIYRKLPEDQIPVSDYALDAFEPVNTTTPVIRYNIGVSFFL